MFDLNRTFPTLRNAPITEAVIDIRAELPPSVYLEHLLDFGAGISDRFTETQQRESVQARIEWQKGAPPRVVAPPPTPDGYLFQSPEERLIVQARLDGFTLSRLRPYHDGDTFLAQARELWRRYVEIARPTKVTRLAIRNVNRIEMERSADLQRYVLTAPEIARGLPQEMLHFFMRVILADSSGALAIVTETVAEPAASASTIPLIFDIDAFREIEFQADDPEIWSALGVLRQVKNRIFFRSLTPEALEAFR